MVQPVRVYDDTRLQQIILEIRPKQRAIIASGFSESDRVKECERLGAGQYISKPYTFEAIGVAVKNELNRSCPAMT